MGTKSFLQNAKFAMLWLRGRKLREFKIMGIQIYLITQTVPSHYNLFVFYVPILRVVKEKARFAINILLFSWIHSLFAKLKFERLSNGHRITLLGKVLYESILHEPYKFPAANFKD